VVVIARPFASGLPLERYMPDQFIR
jgi:hypothetical protein